jgi:hypothetical protein
MDGMDRVEGAEPALVLEAGAARKRDSLFMSAKLRIGDAPAVHEVRVRNLSTGGLMIEFARSIDQGAEVTLEMNGLGELSGRVAWCTRGRAGIALDAPVDPKRARKPIGTGRGTPEYAKPALVARVPRR